MRNNRLLSLDIFRGLTMIFMTIVNNPGSWSDVFPPLLHAHWHGYTPTDLVFPFFVFAMGFAVPLAMPTKEINSSVFEKIAIRSGRIFALGLFLNFFGTIPFFDFTGLPLLLFRLVITGVVWFLLTGNFSTKIKSIGLMMVLGTMFVLAYSGVTTFADVRIPGVLQRIALVYGIIASLYLITDLKKQILLSISILVGYYLIFSCISAPEIAVGSLEEGHNLASWIDSLLLKNHVWSQTKTWDPEGILSTLPAIASGLIGLIIGQWIQKMEAQKIAVSTAVLGVLLIMFGHVSDLFFPINKALWTSSYVLVTSGWACVLFAFLYYFVDFKKYNLGNNYFLSWGVNPMFVFFFSGILPRALGMINFNEKAVSTFIYQDVLLQVFTFPKMASLSYALLQVVFWSICLWILYKNKKIFKV